MGDIILILHVGFRKKKKSLQFKLILGYCDFHIFLYQSHMSLYGNNALSEDNAYNDVLSENSKKQNYIPSP